MIFAVDLSKSWSDKHHSFLWNYCQKILLFFLNILVFKWRNSATSKFEYFLINKNVKIIVAGKGQLPIFVLKVSENSICQVICLVICLVVLKFQGGKTLCASFCASLIAGSRLAFLCVDCKIKRDLPVSWRLIEILSSHQLHQGITRDCLAHAQHQYSQPKCECEQCIVVLPQRRGISRNGWAY